MANTNKKKNRCTMTVISALPSAVQDSLYHFDYENQERDGPNAGAAQHDYTGAAHILGISLALQSLSEALDSPPA